MVVAAFSLGAKKLARLGDDGFVMFSYVFRVQRTSICESSHVLSQKVGTEERNLRRPEDVQSSLSRMPLLGWKL